MAQAKGVIPRGEDKELLYKNPQTCGYFVFAKLDPTLDRAGLEGLFGSLDQLIAALVEREASTAGTEGGRKVAAVAVGFAPSLFAPERFTPPLLKPAGFRTSVASGSELPEIATPLPHEVSPLSEAPKVEEDVLFYVASTMEARVNRFLSDLAALPAVKALKLERGYQRLDGTEPFGYRDGLRNIKTSERSTRVFVHREERHLEEPLWADGGTYMAYMRISQHPEALAAVGDEAARDAVIGRLKNENGDRLDLAGQGIDPHDEPPTPPQPPSGHVAKAGPRGTHDGNEIFRRGLPFVETVEGQLCVGLNFVSFQASLDQFDVILNDWIMNPHFPSEGVGRDVLLDPNRGIVTFEKIGFFFVPPYDSDGLAAAVLRPDPTGGKPKTGQLVVRKRVVDPSDSTKRFERASFVFQVIDSNGQPVGVEFSSDSTGRALAPEELVIGEVYTLREVSSPFGEKTPLQTINFTMDRPHKELSVENRFTEPHTGYGG
jgi:deferrochelatase/peroxidase EfeB